MCLPWRWKALQQHAVPYSMITDVLGYDESPARCGRIFEADPGADWSFPRARFETDGARRGIRARA